ncbi:hypothetical protein ACWDAZ_42335, partial [Streptomyces sp. NPDC001215]
MTVLLIACAAVATGARPFAALGQWAGEAPQDVLPSDDALYVGDVQPWVRPHPQDNEQEQPGRDH